MSYNAEEYSNADGSPVELYDIVLGATSWHFCSGEDAITQDAVLYTPLTVDRDTLPVGPSERTNDFGISLPATHPFVLKYRLLVPGQKATVTIRRIHRTDGSHAVINLFKGVVVAIAFVNNGATAQIGVAPGTSNFTLMMPRYVYSSQCNHVLGDRWCTIDLETGTSLTGFPYKHSNTVVSVTGKDIVVGGIVGAGYPDDFFAGGVLVTAAGDRRLIVGQTGDHCYVYIPPFEGTALVGTTVAVYAGCDHTLDTCTSKFDNRINYGGFNYVPLTSPFSNSVV